jgi:hypothetical protein
MNRLTTFFVKRLASILQQEHRPRATLLCLKFLGYGLEEIRPSLLQLEKIKIGSIKNGHSVSTSSIYATLAGHRNNPLSKELIAEALGLRTSELFPPQEFINPNPSFSGKKKTPSRKKEGFLRQVESERDFNKI